MLWNELYDYWQVKHVGGVPPSRDALDPVLEIPRLVPNLLLIDVTPEGYRYRLLGSEIARRSGLSLTGMLVGSTGFGGAVKSQWFETVDASFRERKPQLVLLRLTPQLRAEVLLLMLPLAGPGGETEMLLVGAFHEGSLEPPFEIDGLHPIQLFLANENRPELDRISATATGE